MLPAGLETVIPGSLRPQTQYLYSAVTVIGTQTDTVNKITLFVLESVYSSILATKDDIPHVWAVQNCMRLNDINAGGHIVPT